MRILINAFSARQGGGQTYLINLLESIPADLDAEILLLAPTSLKIPEPKQKGRSTLRRLDVQWPVENPFVRAFWERLVLPGLLRKMNIDVLFCPGGLVGTVPPAGCKTVTMFRNMLPFDPVIAKRYPLGYMRFRHWLLKHLMFKSMTGADLVIFISKFAQSVIEKENRGPLRNSAVIPHGISARFRDDSLSLARPDWLPSEGYFLYVSTLDFYKAQIQVVQGYAKLRTSRKLPQKLLLIGPENPTYSQAVRAEIERLGLKESVIIRKVDYFELPAVYHFAEVNLFASESENCPNILLEMLAAGRPILCSSRPPMPEFAEDAAVYFDPSSPEEFADKLAFLLDNPGIGNELATRAKSRSFIYEWSDTAEKTWKAISRI